MPTKKKRVRKIAIVTGGRIEFGYVRPVIKAIEKNPDLDYEIIAANMHVLPEFGHTVDEIYKDKFKVGAAVHNTLAGYTHLTMVKSLGVFLTELPGIIERMAPDFILVAGDRGEPLIAAMTGAHMYIPVAHIQAGELSGNIDGMTRHAITKYAHIHFAANDDAAKRLKKMGEQDFRILNVGAPQLDEFVSGDVTDSKAIRQRYHLPRNKKSILLIQHSVTEEADLAEKQIAESIKAVASLKLPTVIILNNSDAGSRHIREVIARYKNFKARTFNHIPRPDYFGLLKTCDVLVGNSSSGIIEAPLAKIPVVNIGNRQKGRLQSTNVINVGHSQLAIANAIKRALSDKFRARAEKSLSVYGDGNSAKKIVSVLATTPINKKLLVKELTY